jgi:hypothetical protein
LNAHAIAGLLALNLWLLAVGIAVLFGVRGWRSWGELARLSGLAYVLGVALLGVVWVWELVVGIDLGFATIFGSGIVIALIAAVVGYRLGHRLPPRPAGLPPFRLSPVTAVFGALTIVYFEALFRDARLHALTEFDAWHFWVPKAKAIYFFGGLDEQLFSVLINQSYPPLVPTLQAAAFHFMGSPDVVTVHLQFWFLFVGFAGALVGLLSGRVPALFIWPPLLLLLVAPYVIGHAYQPQADFLLDELFVIVALLIALWLADRQDWQLVAAGILLAAVMLTKREGYLFAASVIIAGLIVTWGQRRSAWPRLLALGLLAAAATVPWRVLLAVRHLSSGAPEDGGIGLFSNLDRAWPSLRLALSSAFDYDTWLIVIPIALVAIVAAYAARARVLATYATLLYVFAIAGFTYSTWAFPSLGISTKPALNPIVRLTGEIALLTPALVPLLLAAAWPRERAALIAMRSRPTAWILVIVAALAYPLAVLAGGGPRFPARSDCIHPAKTDGDIEAVFGRSRNPETAAATLARVLELGFKGSVVEPDGCGYLKVNVKGVPTLAVGRELAAEAEKVGLHVTLEKSVP